MAERGRGCYRHKNGKSRRQGRKYPGGSPNPAQAVCTSRPRKGRGLASLNPHPASNRRRFRRGLYPGGSRTARRRSERETFASQRKDKRGFTRKTAGVRTRESLALELPLLFLPSELRCLLGREKI